MLSLVEELSLNFYLWERRGRGWEVWDYPVSIEPLFAPFYSHAPRPLIAEAAYDDGRIPTPFSEIAESVKKFLRGSNGSSESQTHSDPLAELEPVPFEDDSEIKEIQISVPIDRKVGLEYAEDLLLNLASGSGTNCFEIFGTKDRIVSRFACREAELPFLLQQLKAYFPDAWYEVHDNSLRGLLGERKYAAVVDFGLSEEFMRPLQDCRGFEPDPLTGLIGAMDGLLDGETGLVQVLFRSVEYPWAESMIRSVTSYDGDSFFVDSPEMLPLTREKISSPLFASVVRVMAQSNSEKRAWANARSIGGALTVLAKSSSNELIPLNNDDYPDSAHFEDVIQRQSRRTGMILNSRELLNMVHIPSASVRSSKFRGQPRKTKAAPKTVQGHAYVIGENFHQNLTTQITLSTEQRLRHIHIIGSTGVGKSTLLINLIAQDMKAGSGCAVFDPHGDLIDRLVELVPEERVNDVILFDPADTEYPVGFNILEARTEIEKTVLSSDLVALFRRFSTSWGDQMTAVLGNAVSAFVENPAGGTLLELRRFLIEDDFRKTYLKSVKDQEISYFWEKQFPMLKGHALSSILTRLDIFLRPKIIRHIVGQRTGIDCNEIINKRKILLVKLAHGLIGEENAYLLGSLMVSKLHQASMARQIRETGEREPYYLYVDEFQNFVTPSMSSVLEGGRKFGVGLTVSHQQLRNLVALDENLANSLITNPVTRICFRIGDFDAEKLEKGFSFFEAPDLENLGVGEAVVRVERNEDDFNLRTYPTPVAASELASKRRDQIVSLTRERYADRIEEVERSEPLRKKKEVHVVQERVEVIRAPSQKSESKPERSQHPKPTSPRISIDDEKRILSEHRRLQVLTKKMAEQSGYRAVVEELTPDGKGRVDVGLERNGKRFAVEISVTTGDAHELQNIEKCLRAGYHSVFMCSPQKKNLEAIHALMLEQLSEQDRAKVCLFQPEELFPHLDELVAKEMSSETRVKGYRVKVEYKAVSDSERERKRVAITRVIAQAIRRTKKET